MGILPAVTLEFFSIIDDAEMFPGLVSQAVKLLSLFYHGNIKGYTEASAKDLLNTVAWEKNRDRLEKFHKLIQTNFQSDDGQLALDYSNWYADIWNAAWKYKTQKTRLSMLREYYELEMEG